MSLLGILGWIWNTLIEWPIVWFLTTTAHQIGLGWGILAITIIIRTALLPISLLSLKHAQQVAGLQDKIEKLKKKYKNKPQELARAQAQLFKQAGVVPAAGCLPGVVQLIVLIGLYRALLFQLSNGGDGLTFWWFNLKEPDPLFILPVLAGLFQAGTALLMTPPTSTSTSKDKSNLQQTQKQMMVFMSVFTVFLASRFPAGIALYWAASSLFSIVQQIIIKKTLWKRQ